MGDLIESSSLQRRLSRMSTLRMANRSILLCVSSLVWRVWASLAPQLYYGTPYQSSDLTGCIQFIHSHAL